MTDTSYLAIVILLGIGVAIAAVMVVGSWLLGPRRPTPYKLAPYECGMTPEGNARERFPVKFYLIAMLFIIFDIESIFLYPWYAVFNNKNLFINPATGQTDMRLWQNFKVFTFCEVAVFLALLALGYVYLIRKRAFTWEDMTGPAEVNEPNALTGSASKSEGEG
ncbi:MAG: NADH-quinone oxidoreductase subunit A [bacterium]